MYGWTLVLSMRFGSSPSVDSAAGASKVLICRMISIEDSNLADDRFFLGGSLCGGVIAFFLYFFFLGLSIIFR